MNNPKYKIHGTERRTLKKELRSLKIYVKKFWYYHQLDKDIASLYGIKESYLMTDDEAQKRINNTVLNIKSLENSLSILYDE